MATSTSRRGERGAILVHTGVALVGLLAFSALSVDYGLLWVARRQAQNAADAAALAGAISLAYGDPNDLARVRAVAEQAGEANPVWGTPPSIDPATDVIVGPCPILTPGDPDLCVRVNVYRNQARGNPLPTFFARLVGVDAQGVRATATAQVAMGDASQCIRPWAIPDKWNDVNDTTAPIDTGWTMDDTFDMYQKQNGKDVPVSNPDIYVPPTASSPGTGFTTDKDMGRRVTLKYRDANAVTNPLGAGNFLPIALPLSGEPGTGGKDYETNIAQCNGTTLRVGDTVQTEPGAKVGPTKQGIEALIAQDPGASWHCTGAVSADGSCTGYVDSTLSPSPRVVPVPVFDVAAYEVDRVENGTKANGRHPVRITRLVGFFIEDLQANGDVVGRVTYYPASGGISNGNIDESANFLRKVILVR